MRRAETRAGRSARAFPLRKRQRATLPLTGVRRLLALLTLVASLTLAGCASENDSPGTTTPTPGSPTPTPAESTPTPSTPPATPTSPTPPAGPRAVYNGTHDFSGPPPAPNAPPRRENFTLEPAHRTLQVRISWTSTGPAGDVSLSAGAAVRLVDPAGAVALECTGKDDADSNKDITGAAAGAWKVEYAGSGTGKVTVTVTAAP